MVHLNWVGLNITFHIFIFCLEKYKNSCKNPDGKAGDWCFTTVPYIAEWDFCSTRKICERQCRRFRTTSPTSTSTTTTTEIKGPDDPKDEDKGQDSTCATSSSFIKSRLSERIIKNRLA